MYEEEVNKVNYSTNEQRIGTWIDGKPLYRVAGEIDFNNDLTILNGTTTFNFKKVTGWVVREDGIQNQVPYEANENKRAEFYAGSGKISLAARGSGRLSYIFEYTKTTD